MYDNNYGPFKSLGDFSVFVITLHCNIDYERKMLDFATEQFNKVGGEKAYKESAENASLASAWENEIEKYKHIISTLEKLAEDLRKRLSNDALETFNFYFNNNESKKAV